MKVTLAALYAESCALPIAVLKGRQVSLSTRCHFPLILSLPRNSAPKPSPMITRSHSFTGSKMISVYELKPRFQEMLRPISRHFAEAGISANAASSSAQLRCNGALWSASIAFLMYRRCSLSRPKPVRGIPGEAVIVLSPILC